MSPGWEAITGASKPKMPIESSLREAEHGSHIADWELCRRRSSTRRGSSKVAGFGRQFATRACLRGPVVSPTPLSD